VRARSLHVGVTRAVRSWRRQPHRESILKLIDEMLALNLLTADQHAEIGAWVHGARTPERIMAMPPHLWRALELASVLMDFDAGRIQVH
jgi:hypothetical protein